MLANSESADLVRSVLEAAFVVCICYAMVSDALTLKISNWISVALVILFAVYASLFEISGPLGFHLAVGLGALVVGVILFALRWMGGGDVKFFSATMLWMGPEEASAFVVLTTLFGGVMAALMLVLRNSPIRYWTPSFAPLARFMTLANRGVCPYGLAIGAAALCLSGGLFYP